MDFHRFSSIFIDFRGFSLIFIDFYRFSWIFVDFHGFLVYFMRFHGFQDQGVEQPVATCGGLWRRCGTIIVAPKEEVSNLGGPNTRIFESSRLEDLLGSNTRIFESSRIC